MGKTKRVSPVTGEVSGKIGTMIWSRNRFGEFIKTQRKASNPNTDWQRSVREIRAELAQAWNALSDDDKKGWAVQVVNFSIQNKRKTGYLTGYEWFIQINTFNVETGGAVMTAAPQSLEPAEYLTDVSVTVKCTPGSEDISVAFAPVIASGQIMQIKATPPQKTSAAPKVGSYRSICYKDHTFTTGTSIKSAYIARFPGLFPVQSGVWTGWKITMINQATGQVSASYYRMAQSSV